MRIPVKHWILVIGVFLVSFGGVALAADTIDPQDGSLDIAKSVYNAFAGGHYAYAAALGLILGVALIKRYLGPRVPALHSEMGSAGLTLAGSFGTAMAAGLAAPSASVTWGLAESSLLVGVGAVGGFEVIKHLVIEPLIKPLQKMLPDWAQPLFSVALWIFDKPAAAAEIEANAVKAGDAAVAAAPAQGATSVVGTPTDVK